MRTSLLRNRRGFTLVEVLVATALLGFSLVVMFGFHAQAVRSNSRARKATDCSYLAQQRMEILLAHLWDSDHVRAGTDLADGWSTTSTASSDWEPLYHPMIGAGMPEALNALGENDLARQAASAAPTYYVTWQVMDTSADGDWIQLWVRCTYQDSAFGNWHGQTISAYKFMD